MEHESHVYYAIVQPTEEAPKPHDPRNKQYIRVSTNENGLSQYFFEVTKAYEEKQLEGKLQENQWLVQMEIFNGRRAIKKVIEVK